MRNQEVYSWAWAQDWSNPNQALTLLSLASEFVDFESTLNGVSLKVLSRKANISPSAFFRNITWWASRGTFSYFRSGDSLTITMHKICRPILYAEYQKP